ncbi:MAG TPA: bifunctional diaminohydroxyphosphoribosylaminopyrimidine deaminase/5-amino-6-(5-phosphoribosylamino)uracil reductase RibD [Longimicrobiales bacterium]|nr:bifunctional diaminohydroxyphosphoribosylaminopyrimidine deaminase/5-amino-6-(5-phosphoribosylamino)uracil reductase RibD [Longimicrobiales bacterium]
MIPEDHAAHMRRALELARRGWGSVHPNPLVGAVLVRDGAVVGEGFHAEYGGPHAEVVALREAGEAARGATLYVTLEPCAHHGKTPPCVDAIIAAGVARVVYAVADPNTRARGGAQRLMDAGVEVMAGVERDAARALNAQFFHLHEVGSPYVALKLAMSLDAGIAKAPGVQTSLTGPAALAAMHALRSGYDAILIGINTALTDDPLLTVRHAPVRKPPVRLVADTHARLPLESKLVQTVSEAQVWVLCAEDAPQDRVAALGKAGVRVLRVPRDREHIDIGHALETLAEEGIQSIFAEGGAKLAASLLALEAVQRMYIFLAPLFLGPGAVPAFGLAQPEQDRWRCTSTEWHGSDVLVTMDLAPEN